MQCFTTLLHGSQQGILASVCNWVSMEVWRGCWLNMWLPLAREALCKRPRGIPRATSMRLSLDPFTWTERGSCCGCLSLCTLGFKSGVLLQPPEYNNPLLCGLCVFPSHPYHWDKQRKSVKNSSLKLLCCDVFFLRLLKNIRTSGFKEIFCLLLWFCDAKILLLKERFVSKYYHLTLESKVQSIYISHPQRSLTQSHCNQLMKQLIFL